MGDIEKDIKSKFESERHKLVVNLMYTSNLLKNFHSELVKPFNITIQQYNILRILRGNGDFMPMNTVKERMIDKSPNTTRLVDKLIAKNLVERKRCDEDRRVVYVKVCDSGLDLLKAIEAVMDKPFSALVSPLNEKEAKQANDVLDKLRK